MAVGRRVPSVAPGGFGFVGWARRNPLRRSGQAWDREPIDSSSPSAVRPGTPGSESGQSSPVGPLDNPVWHALTSHHAGLAEVAGGARRYPSAVAPFGGVDRLDAGAWLDLAQLTETGGPALLARADPIDPPEGWTVAREILGQQMLLGAHPGVALPPSMRRLTADDVPAMLALAALARPGPFSVRTIELGGYLGVEEDGALVAMAGERLHFDRYCEISAVCTHPDARGRGLAAALTLAVADQIAERGEQPLLHVADDNTSARRLYERLGFETRTQMRFVALRPPAQPS